MGDYAGNWRYGQATDRRQAGTTPTKRPRRDYGMWSYIRGIGLVVCLFSFACERLGLFFSLGGLYRSIHTCCLTVLRALPGVGIFLAEYLPALLVVGEYGLLSVSILRRLRSWFHILDKFLESSRESLEIFPLLETDDGSGYGCR